MLFAFLNTRGWNEEKWRTLIKEGEEYDVIGVGETGWHDSIEWHEGDWVGIGVGRSVGEKKGGGVGVIMKEKGDRRITEVQKVKDMKTNLGFIRGDILTVKITEGREEWWVTVVYMGVEGRENYDNNRKLYDLMIEIKKEVGDRKWIIMGDLNGHTGLNSDRVNGNGKMILDFVEQTRMKMKNWELEDPITWRDRGAESAIDYIIINDKVEKYGCGIWKNEQVDISDHILIGITCGKTKQQKKVVKSGWREKWKTNNVDWVKYREKLDEQMFDEIDKRDRTINDWEKDIKKKILNEANRSVGTQKFKIGKTKLKRLVGQ